MCGRYSLAGGDLKQLRARFPIGEGVEVRRRFNVAPTDEVLAVTTARDGTPRGEELRWGLVPAWSKDSRGAQKLINARAETLAQRPAFRSALERFRCLIVADGFYEWRRDEHGGKRAFHITRVDHEPFAFAGLWSVWHRGEPDEVRSCTIVTTAANDLVAPLHDRMPVILDRANEQVWLEHGTPTAVLLDLLRSLPSSETALRPVGPAVNDVRYDGPACLDDPPPAAPLATGEPTLF
jgi:putative SOS response-associated peptidase YedK